MKRALIVTGAGVGTALLALLVAVLLGGPTTGFTTVVVAVHFGWVLAGVLAAAAAIMSAGRVGGRTAVALGLGMYPITLLFAAFGDCAAVIVCGLAGALATRALVTRTERRERRVRARAAERIAERKYHAEWLRSERVARATENVPTAWLIDVFAAPESTPREDMLAALDADAAWALARLHRKGVPAEDVAERWTNGEPLDADALVASHREGGVA